jgi:hypothetical protein
VTVYTTKNIPGVNRSKTPYIVTISRKEIVNRLRKLKQFCRATVPFFFRAGALMTVVPLLGDLCLDPIYPSVSSFCPGIAWAGENDLFAETREQVTSDLESCFGNAGVFLGKEDFRAVRRQLSLINLDIDKHKKKFSRGEIKTYKKRIAGINESVKRTIDSLVTEAITIVEKRGQKAGYDFRQMLANQKGISETDLAPVDQAIVERGTYEGNEDASLNANPPEAATPAPVDEPPLPSVQDTARVQETVPAEGPALVPEDAPAQTSQPDVVHPAPPLPAREDTATAARRSDSESAGRSPSGVPIGPDDEETDKNRLLALERAAKVRSLIEAGKIEEARIVFRIYQQQIGRYSGPAAYESLKTSVDAATVLNQQQQTHAVAKAKAIERLVDQNRIAEAFVELNKSREALKPYLDKDVFNALDKNVRQAYVGFIQTQVKAHATMRDIREILAQKNAEKANAAFETHRVELKSGLSKDAFEALRRDIAAAYTVILDQKKYSAYLCKNIASLIKAGNGAAAWELWSGNRLLLQKHLDYSRFSSLESSVNKALNNFLTRQKRANSLVASIDSLLSNAHIEEANAQFQDIRKRLKTGLADDKRFFELKDRLSEKYADLRAKQRSALRTSQEIEYLIRLREGRKAYSLFNQEKPALGKYLSPEAVRALKDAAARADAGYTLRCETARNAASAIGALMDQNKVEQAYAGYRKTEDDFDFYLDGDPSIEALGKRVVQAYTGLQERKQRASEQVRQIRRLIEKRRGNQAYADFNDRRPELARYVDAKTIDALATETDRANREFNEAVDRASRQITRILGFIAQNQVEEANDAFNSAEADLRFYLKQEEYEGIKTRVEASKSVLQGKKKEALAIVKDMDRFIDRKRGDSAYQIFSRNDSFLVVYLNPATCKKAGARAEAAKNDHEKNRKSAQTLEEKLYRQITRDHVLDAQETFGKKRDVLETYLDKSRFVRLKTAIAVSYNAFMAERKKARAIASALMRMIRRRQGVEANKEFDLHERTLARYLPSDEYLEIAANVTKAYQSTLRGRTEAKESAAAIRQLLEQDEVAYAYSTFKEMRPTLEQYTSDDQFTALETEVVYAWSAREKKVRQAREYAKKLRQLVAKNRTADAYKKFRLHHQVLAKYLEAQSFADL